MLKQLLFISIFLSLIDAESIKVAAAANVSYAIDDLVHLFNKQNPDIKVLVTLSGTGKLTAQIKHGAPYQILMAADMNYPKALFKEGLATEEPKVYAQGSLALFSREKRNFNRGLSLLLDGKIQRIAIANPKTAPYGKASFEALKNRGLLQKLKSKFVYGESISQTVAYAATAADIGLIAKSSLYDPKMAKYKEGEHWIEVPRNSYSPIKQGIVVLSTAKENSAVKKFYLFMLSKKASAILKRYGYSRP